MNGKFIHSPLAGIKRPHVRHFFIWHPAMSMHEKSMMRACYLSLSLYLLSTAIPACLAGTAQSMAGSTLPSDSGSLAKPEHLAQGSVMFDDRLLQKLKDQAGSGQTIMLPMRNAVFDIHHVWPASSPDDINFWLLWGSRAPDGGIPLSWGYDPIFRTLDNSFMLNRGRNIPGRNGYLLRLDDYFSVDTTPGTSRQNITGTFAPHCIETARNLNDGIWCVEAEMTSRSRHGENVTDAVLALRPADALDDGKGPRGEIWGRLTQVNDSTGLDAAHSGSMVGHELDLSASGKADQNECESCAGRDMVQFIASTYSPTGRNNEVTNGLIFSSHDDSSYFSRVVNIATFIKDAGIDLSRSRIWTLRQKVMADAPNGATVLRMRDTDAGIFVGQAVSGLGIAMGTRVSALTANTVSLSHPILVPIPQGQTVTFTSDGDALRLGSGQAIAFDAAHAMRIFESSDGQNLIIAHQGTNRLTVGADGTARLQTANPAQAALRLSGTGRAGLDTTGLSSASDASAPLPAFKMAAGQCVTWEAALTIRMCVSDGIITFYQQDVPLMKIGGDRVQTLLPLQTTASFSTPRYMFSTLPTGGMPDGARAYCADCMFANGVTGVPIVWHAHGSIWTDEAGMQPRR